MKGAKAILSLLLAAAIVIAAWEVVARGVANSKLFPSPEFVFTSSVASFAQFSDAPNATGVGVLAAHLWQTLGRVLVGTTLGALLGVAYALAGFRWLRFRAGASGFVTFFRSIPLLALMPLFVFWFGGAPIGIHVWMAFASFTVMATGAIDGVAHIDEGLVQKAQILGATRSQITRQIVLPAIVPQVAASYKALMGLSWAFALGAEFLVARSGLGYLASYAYMYSNMGQLLLILSLYGAFGVLTFALLHLLNPSRS